ncbi:MAG: galactokinase [Phycisphaerales bacterium]|nr:galactokinase [Phycisphaerales bacterium]
MAGDAGITEVVSRARSAFRSAFEREPAWAAAAPGRVNLIGEHTDYNDGFALPMAIDLWTVALAAPAVGEVSRIVAADLRQRAELRLSRPIDPNTCPPGEWASYIAGVASLLLVGAGVSPAPSHPGELDLLVASSLPVGSGLASSAAMETAVSVLLEQAWGVTTSPRERAALCRRAENQYAGVPCGLMDQFISSYARAGTAMLLDCRTGQGQPIPMPPPSRIRIVIADTGVRHALAGGEYAARRSVCAAAAGKLGVPALRDVSPEMVEARRGSLTPEELRAARHVTTENARTLAAAEALRSGDLAALGRLMAASHASLRDDFRVSSPELDTLVELAAGVPGVIGARMTGGGFGGCVVILGAPESVRLLGRELTAGYRARHGRDCAVLTTDAAGGARPIVPA